MQAETGGLEEAFDVGDIVGEGAGGVEQGAEREFGEADGRLGAAGVADLVDERGKALEVVLEAMRLVERAPGGGEDGVVGHRGRTTWRYNSSRSRLRSSEERRAAPSR